MSPRNAERGAPAGPSIPDNIANHSDAPIVPEAPDGPEALDVDDQLEELGRRVVDLEHRVAVIEGRLDGLGAVRRPRRRWPR